ncbi:MAG TPA: aspartate-semialdehyde dehydrogenase, partial [Actinobacteria bacterium]|nr:aspartate-semialdehyde dehydrogenase [Actinomycetota bacterium]
MAERDVVVVGATGAVGRTMLSILEARNFPVGELRLMASARSAGQKVSTRWGEIEVEDLVDANPAGMDIALFSAGGARSKEHAPRFVEEGVLVVDNSSAFRMDPDVPLVVAQVNDHAAADHQGIIANPNCTTMVLMMAAGPLHRTHRIRRMVATTYQSVSGSGMAGMEGLADEAAALIKDRDALAKGGWVDPSEGLYERPIGFNVLPMAGTVTEHGYTDEEWKLVNETRKILDAPDIAVEPTCVRVPVMVGHGIAASIFFDRPLDAATARAALG